MYTIYTDDSNQVSIICPKCRSEQNIDITKLKDTQKKLEGKCKCGEPYEFKIEHRKRYREGVRLTGEYSILDKEEKGELIIRDLSMSGIRFECPNPHHISKDDILKVKFKLDRPKILEIQKLVKVIRVREHIIGAQFMETKSYKRYLEFYLQI
jgi:hypothetical protein